MASRWPVSDDIARRQSVGTVKGLGRGDDPAAALRSAIPSVRGRADGEAKADHTALLGPVVLLYSLVLWPKAAILSWAGIIRAAPGGSAMLRRRDTGGER